MLLGIILGPYCLRGVCVCVCARLTIWGPSRTGDQASEVQSAPPFPMAHSKLQLAPTTGQMGNTASAEKQLLNLTC